MPFLAASIFCSVAVSVLLKVARRHGIGIVQAVGVNYAVAAALSLWLLKPDLSGWRSSMMPHWRLFVLLGVLLPAVFVLMGRAVQEAGIAKSDAAQRLSLFLPVLAAFTLFGENLSANRFIGLLLAFAALLCLVRKPGARTATARRPALLLLGVWAGYGSIDILLKQLSKTENFTANLLLIFVLAGCMMTAYLLLKRVRWQWRDLVGGLLLGVLNFSNILFYLKAHRAFPHDPTLVFAGMNIGVIVLGTLTGSAVFKEKISTVNFLGIALALAAIVCLYYRPLAAA